MNFKKTKEIIRLSRPANVCITLISIPVACWIAGGTNTDLFDIILASVSGAFVTAGANAINDAFDIDIDRINKPERPLPLGLLTVHNAQSMWFLVSCLSICLNIFINIPAFIIVLFSVVLLYYYSARLKRTIILGNITVAFMTGMAFIYGGVVVGHTDRAVIPAIFAFLINFAREIIKDVEDLEGDRKERAITLPVKYGIQHSLVLSTVILIVLVCFTFIVAEYSVYQIPFLYIVVLADILIGISGVMIWRDSSPAQMKFVSTNLKLSMIIGLAAIIVGSM